LADKKFGLGRGIGALIPDAQPAKADPYFADEKQNSGEPANAGALVGGDDAKNGAYGAGTGNDAAGSGEQSPDFGTETRPIDVFFGFSSPGGQAAGQSDNGGLLPVPGARFAHLLIDSIVPNPKQPRSVFEPEAFAELVHSVREIGVLQPIVVRQIDDRDGSPAYELIMGERRLRASKEAGLEKIPAVVRDTQDEHMLRDALLENLHRSNLNPLEEASAYQQMIDDFGITQDELAERIGRSRPQITNTIRLLKLPVSVQRRVAAGVLSAGHARAILGAPDESRMEYFANKVVNEGLSVRSLEELIGIDKPKKGKATIKQGGIVNGLSEIADSLGDHLNTKVKVTLGKGKGQIVIDFGSIADLNRIVGDMGLKRD
jgi:ParB family chromosome partitioning protein